MLKASAGKTVILGLSHENLKRLKKGNPIKLNLSEMGFDDQEIIIMSGATEQSMAAMLAQRKKH